MLAAEVLEMGEHLFSLALEARDNEASGAAAQEGEAGQTFPLAKIAAAGEEFFAALRLLLDIAEE
jgi:hypothetical protein